MPETIYRKLKDLTKLKGNPRFIKDDDFARLCVSVKSNPDYFEARPLILSDRTGELVIIAGNQRYEAAKHLKLKEVPTCLLEGLDETREKEIIIRDNVSNGSWDFDILANEWTDFPLADWGVDLPDFDAVETEPIEEDEAAVGEMIDKAEELNKKWEVVCGEKFSIGRHFLVCGDSTKAEDVSKLLDGAKPNLMITDPPYGVEYDANWRNESFRADGTTIGGRAIGKVENDHESDWTPAWQLFEGNVVYCWHDGRQASVVQASLEIAGFEMRSQIIWAKNNFAISRGHYHWKHEPCWYAFRKGESAGWIGDHSQTTLWEIDKPQKSETGHSTQKPVECMARPIRNHEGDVYEPFAGSGTTLVAAEQLNRICYAMELSPAYVAVCLERLTTLGLEAKRID